MKLHLNLDLSFFSKENVELDLVYIFYAKLKIEVHYLNLDISL